MLGYDTPWTPVAYAISPDGTIRDTYNHIANGYRGRFNTTNFWDLFYYYTYVRGEDLAQEAPYYYEAFKKRIPSNFYYGGSLNIIGGTTATVTEGDASFVRFQATEQGSKVAFLNGSTGEKTIGFKIRTNGIAQLELNPGINDTMTLPDTKGQWQYVVYKMGTFQGMGDILYMKVHGMAGTVVDIDHINVKACTELTPPSFRTGNGDLKLFAYEGASIATGLSATDANSADAVSYDSTNLPQGAMLDSATGAFACPIPSGVSCRDRHDRDGIR